MDAPENRSPLRQKEIGYLRGETTVIHPGENQIRFESAHQPNQTPQSQGRRQAKLHSRRIDIDPQTFNPLAQRTVVKQADHDWFKTLSIASRQLLIKHDFSPTNGEVVDNIHD